MCAMPFIMWSSAEIRLPWHDADQLTMRNLLLIPLVLCSLTAQAKRLNVRLMMSPGRVVVHYLCPDMVGANTNSALLPAGANSFDSPVERSFPGSVSVSVSGGVPPYRYDWHGMMADASTCSAIPGMVRVTVSDAEGNTVTKIAHVSVVRTVLPSPCGMVPLVDIAQFKRSASGDIYFGSAKPRYRSPRAPSDPYIKQELRTGVKYIPPGPQQGGGQKLKPLPASKVVR